MKDFSIKFSDSPVSNNYFREGPRNGGGLPRQNFNSDQFFRDQPDPFSDFDRPRRFGDSNSRLFENDFFDNFSNNNGFGSEFFRSSLPRRFAANSSNNSYEHPIHIKRENLSQESPTMHRKTQSFAENGASPNFQHQRQSSSGSNYPNNVNNNRPQNFSQQPQYQHNQPNSNGSNFKNNSNFQSQQPQPQPPFIEINNSDSSSYTHGELNPDNRRRPSNHSINGSELSSNPSTKILEDLSTRLNSLSKQESGPAISDKAIPLPPPVSMIIPVETNPLTNKAEVVKEKSTEKNDLKEDSTTEKIEKSNTNKPKGFVPLAACVEQLISLLDETERRVELLRDTAAQLENEKDNVLDILNNIKMNAEILRLKSSEIDELNLTTDRLLKRCKAVDVVVNTPRNNEQMRAITEVNRMIDEEVAKMHDNLKAGKNKIERFLNACNPDEPSGPIDERFQTKIVECTADDQKKIRRRLAQIITQCEQAERTCPELL